MLALIIVLIVIVVLLALFLAFYLFYRSRLKTIFSIKKLTNYDDKYDLYSVDIKYHYDLDKIISHGVDTTEATEKTLAKFAFPLIPVKVDVPSFGCSCFTIRTNDDRVVMGRNYDFRYDTSGMLVNCHPKNGYKSIAFASLNNIGFNEVKDRNSKMASLITPFVCLDGINEKGLSMAILTLDSKPTMHNTGKEKIGTGFMLRAVLDNAATVDEAIELFKKYDMAASNGRDYHFIVSDAKGNSVAIEYDPEKEDRPMVVTPTRSITNFFIMHIDKVLPSQKNGIYGHGKERYDKIEKVLIDNEGKYNNEVGWEALMAAAQEPGADVTSNTQWSILFDNTNKSAEISLRRRFNDKYTFYVN